VSKSKIRDEEEARRMLRAGTTYAEMVRYYEDVYHVKTSEMLWSRAYKRLVSDGEPKRLGRRLATIGHYGSRNVPWILVGEELPDGTEAGFAGSKYLRALETVDAIESGRKATRRELAQLAEVKAELEAGNLVIDYDEDAHDFRPASRRDGVDKGWIRDPFYDDEGNPVPLDSLKGVVWDDAIVDFYPFDPKTLVKPPTGK
jgi:hypothetical protein